MGCGPGTVAHGYGSIPLYVASGIARVDPVKTFIPLLKYYCLPILAMGYLIAVGVQI